jgi:hypothetical protein
MAGFNLLSANCESNLHRLEMRAELGTTVRTVPQRFTPVHKGIVTG